MLRRDDRPEISAAIAAKRGNCFVTRVDGRASSDEGPPPLLLYPLCALLAGRIAFFWSFCRAAGSEPVSLTGGAPACFGCFVLFFTRSLDGDYTERYTPNGGALA